MQLGQHRFFAQSVRKVGSLADDLVQPTDENYTAVAMARNEYEALVASHAAAHEQLANEQSTNARLLRLSEERERVHHVEMEALQTQLHTYVRCSLSMCVHVCMGQNE